MKKRVLMFVLTLLFAITASLGMIRIVYGTGSTDIPIAYVISDGSDCYYISFEDLFTSYLVYRGDADADGARLAKFYFDTISIDVMERFKAYVSSDTTQFVGFNAIFTKYIETRDVDETYIWFNSGSATPAFSAITKVWVLNAGGAVTGRYYVNTNGYIIRRSVYVLDTTVPEEIAANAPTGFSLSVTSDDLGCDTLAGSLSCEVTGGSGTLEVETGGVWQTVTDGTLGSFASITPDWTASMNVRFTAHSTGAYSLKFQLKTDGGEVLAEQVEGVAVTGAMQLTATVPTFRVGRPAQISLTTIANGDAGRMVRAYFAIPSGAAVEYLDSATGNWLPLPAVFGPDTGFAVADGMLSLRAQFTEPGAKTIGVEYVEVGTGIVLAGTDIAVTVEQPMDVTADMPEFFAGEPQTFMLTTTAHDDADKKVRVYFTMPSDVTLEYLDEDTGGWLPLTDAYGPAAGFAAADAAYPFRATVSGIGMKAIEVQFVEVDTGAVLAEERFIATAQYRMQPSISIPGMASLTLPSGGGSASVNIANPAKNRCQMVVSLILNDGTVVFTSGLLNPGESVGVVALPPLPQGVYAAIIRYEAYDAEDGSALNSAEVSISLIVQ